MARGRVHGSEGGIYRVRLESGQDVEASLRGRLKRESRAGDRVVVGDRVEVEERPDGSARIERVHPRKTQVARRGPGRHRPKVLAANVDRMVVVAAVARPEPRQAILDRLLVIGESNGLEAVLVFNKADLLNVGMALSGRTGSIEDGHARVADLIGLYGGLGYRVLKTSAVTGTGLNAFQGVLCSGTSALVGPSGVGKSSLLNAIEPGLGLRIGELSARVGRGRHTTVSGRLIALDCGGLVADTPGFSDVGLWGVGSRTLERCFPEFAPYREECRFRGCTHLHEPGCRVREALEAGEIDAGRFGNYGVLYAEAEDG